ncbi:MAG: restriction endonuclease [Bacteroidaceae bacterium]|nr:restriction endonuclease [Bacteroidaceae bacterium]
MIPEFQSFMLPFLDYLKDGKEHSLKECVEAMRLHFHLTDEEMAAKLPSGTDTIVRNRTQWSRTYLGKAGLVDTVKRGVYVINKEGLKLLDEKPAMITTKLLNSKYPSFREFSSVGTNKNVSPAVEEVIAAQTPEALIDNSIKKINSQLASELIDMVLMQSPQFFESLVVELLEKMGYGSGFKTQYSHDDGIDGVINEDTLGLDVIHIQAKRWKSNNKVGKKELQSFVGAMSGNGGQKGVFITTSSYTKEALDYKPAIKLAKIDGEQLAAYMIKYNIGVSIKKTYEIKRIDMDYFETYDM